MSSAEQELSLSSTANLADAQRVAAESGVPAAGGPAGKNRSRAAGAVAQAARSPGSTAAAAAASCAASTAAAAAASAAASAAAGPAAAVALDERAAPRLREYPAPGAAWTTTLVQSDQAFEALAGEWSSLLAECADANVFLSHEWMHAWWSAYRPQARLAIVLARRDGRLRAIAPLMIEPVRRAGVVCRVLRFIGDGTGETDHVNFITDRTDRASSVARLLEAIDALPWDVAEFNQVPQDSANASDLLAWIDRRGLRATVERSPCPVRRLPARFDAVLASLPSRLRTSVRSSTKKLEQKHAVEFGIVTDARELPQALATFFDNHASRWQGKGQAGAFADARRRAFYESLTPRLLRRGWLRFFWLKLDGRTVAQQYCFALDGTVMLLQEGFDFGHAADNVGNVLRSKVFEHLIGSGATCYDFLAGTSRHKQSWSDGVVIDLKIRCARRSFKGWLFHAVPCHVQRAKDVLRPWRDRLLRGRSNAPAAPAKADGAGGSAP